MDNTVSYSNQHMYYEAFPVEDLSNIRILGCSTLSTVTVLYSTYCIIMSVIMTRKLYSDGSYNTIISLSVATQRPCENHANLGC